MPTALRRSCATPGCPAVVTNGHCPEHTKARNHWRGSAASRGYDHRWVRFRTWVFSELTRLAVHGIGDGAVCGARLPGTPETADSQCHAEGRLTTKSLALDHFPPLTEAERADPRAVCNPRRVQVLCEHCHNAKTRREQAA